MFDAYAQFEELSLSKKMEEVAEMENPGDEDEVEVELKMARYSQYSYWTRSDKPPSWVIRIFTVAFDRLFF